MRQAVEGGPRTPSGNSILQIVFSITWGSRIALTNQMRFN